MQFELHKFMAYDNLMTLPGDVSLICVLHIPRHFLCPDGRPLSPASLHIFKTCIWKTLPPLRRDFCWGEKALLLVFTSKLFDQNRPILPLQANRAAQSLPLLPYSTSAEKDHFGDDDGASRKSEQGPQEGGKALSASAVGRRREERGG